MGRARGARPGLRRVLDGPDRAPPRGSVHQRGSRADQRAAPVDHRHLRLHGRRRAHHDGHARRPDRPPTPVADRRRRLRPRIAARRLLDERRDAHRVPRPPRDRGRDHRSLDAVADPEHVRGRESAHVRDRRLDHGVLARRGARSSARRCPARVLLVGLGLPARRARDGPAAGARPAPSSGVPRSGRRPARPRERRTVARRRAGGRVRPQADGAGRPRVDAGSVDPRWPRGRRRRSSAGRRSSPTR